MIRNRLARGGFFVAGAPAVIIRRQRDALPPDYYTQFFSFSQEKGSNSATAFGSAQEGLRMA